MKTSFYFVAWILVYVLIDILNIQLLKENSFLSACLIVWGGAYFINKLFEKQIENVKNKSLVNFYEKIYTNNISSLRKTKALEFAFEFVCLLYIVTLLVSFINLDFKGFIEYGIFGLFSIFSGYKTYKLFTKLLLLLKNKSLNEDVIC